MSFKSSVELLELVIFDLELDLKFLDHRFFVFEVATVFFLAKIKLVAELLLCGLGAFINRTIGSCHSDVKHIVSSSESAFVISEAFSPFCTSERTLK